MQRYNTIREPNSFGVSYVGYPCSGYIDVCNYEDDNTREGSQSSCSLWTQPAIHDRTLYNNGDWYILWQFMDSYNEMFGNEEYNCGDTELHKLFKKKFEHAFNLYSKTHAFQFFRKRSNVLILINSNSAQVDRIRSERGISSDYERSKWKFYTDLQNEMYKLLYPDCHIDYAWFSNAKLDDIKYGITQCIHRLMDDYQYTIMDSLLKLKSKRVDLKLPTPTYNVFGVENDFYLNNMKTHVYRESLKRIGKNIINDDDGFLEFQFDNLPVNIKLHTYNNSVVCEHEVTPNFVSVADAVDKRMDTETMDTSTPQSDIVCSNEETVEDNEKAFDSFSDFVDYKINHFTL